MNIASFVTGAASDTLVALEKRDKGGGEECGGCDTGAQRRKIDAHWRRKLGGLGGSFKRPIGHLKASRISLERCSSVYFFSGEKELGAGFKSIPVA